MIELKKKGNWKGTEVALKKLKNLKATTEFVNELNILSKLHHPHILQYIFLSLDLNR
jgi:hypothetical protein